MIMRSIEGKGGNVINNLRYAANTVVIAETEQQQLMNIVVQEKLKACIWTVHRKKIARASEGTYWTYLQKRKDMTPKELIHFAYERDVWFGLSK